MTIYFEENPDFKDTDWFMKFDDLLNPKKG